MPTPSHTSARTLLRKLAAERILVLDGAMGTMIQAMKLDEEGYRGARFDAWNREVRGNNDLLNRQPAGRDPRHPLRLLQGRRRHRLDQHVLVDLDRAGRLRPVERRLRAELRGRAARARGGQQGRQRRRPAALRRRRPRPDQPHRLDLAGRRQSRLPRRHLRPAASSPMASRCAGCSTGGADVLLIETIFDTLNAKAAIYAIIEVLRGARRRRAGDDLRHHHRPLRAAAVRPDAGGVLERGAARRAAVGRSRTARSAPNEMRAHIAEMARVCDTLVCAYPNAGLPNEFGHYHERPRRHGGASRRVRRRRPDQHRRRLLRHHARAHRGDRRSGARQDAARGARAQAVRFGCPGSSRSRSRRKSRSSTSASAPTSPARPNSAS